MVKFNFVIKSDNRADKNYNGRTARRLQYTEKHAVFKRKTPCQHPAGTESLEGY